MKRNSALQLTAAWWKDNEPKGLANGKDFGKAVAEFELAFVALRKTGAEAAHDACLKALKALDTAGGKIATEAAKLAKTPSKDPKKASHDSEEMGWTVDVFKKLDKVLGDARSEAQKLLKPAAGQGGSDADGDDADDGNALTNEDAYQAYLKTALMRLRRQPLDMAIALGKVPEDTRALLHKKGSGRALASRLSKETGLKRTTWGAARASETDPQVIVLDIEGMRISGLKKRVELMLKAFKPLPFSRLQVMVDGQEDLSDDDVADDGTSDIPTPPPLPDQATVNASSQFAARLKTLLPAVNQAVQAGVVGADEARQKLGAAGDLARKSLFDAALELLQDAERQLKAALGARQAAAQAAAPAANRPEEGDKGFSIVTFQKARLAWLAARKSVQDQLRQLEAQILDELRDDPDLPQIDNDIRKLDTVLAQLDESLADRLDDALNASDPTARQRFHEEASRLMDRYRDYVSNDPFVNDLESNPFMTLSLRTTVLRTLDVMQKNLGTARS